MGAGWECWGPAALARVSIPFCSPVAQECTLKVQDGKFKLQDLLVVPMQRVLKYHLLLKVRPCVCPVAATGERDGGPAASRGVDRAQMHQSERQTANLFSQPVWRISGMFITGNGQREFGTEIRKSQKLERQKRVPRPGVRVAWSGSLNPVSELPGRHGRSGSRKSFWTDRSGEREWFPCGVRLFGESTCHPLARSLASCCFEVLPITQQVGDTPSRSSVSPGRGLAVCAGCQLSQSLARWLGTWS